VPGKRRLLCDQTPENQIRHGGSRFGHSRRAPFYINGTLHSPLIAPRPERFSPVGDPPVMAVLSGGGMERFFMVTRIENQAGWEAHRAFASSAWPAGLFKWMTQHDGLITIRSGRNHIDRHAADLRYALQIVARSLG